MSAQTVLGDAVVAALKAHAGVARVVTAVFDAPPVRGARPYAEVAEALLTDWSTKDMAGREGRIAIVLRDAGERPVRLRELAGQVDAAVEDLPRDLGEGWRIASLVPVRSRIVREGEGLWAGTNEYSAQGDSVRAAVETLLTPAGYWIGEDGVRADAGRATTIGDLAARVDGAGPGRGVRTIAGSDKAPAEVTIGYYEAARDYQTGVQRAVRAGATGRGVRIELPAVIAPEHARGLAARAVDALDLAREMRRVCLDWSHAAIVPGDRVQIEGEPGQWRVHGWTLEHMVLTLDLKRIAGAAIPARAASGGRGTLAPDTLHGPTRLMAFELPPVDERTTEVAQVAVLASGMLPGWRRAALLVSEDGGESWEVVGGTAAPAVLGTVVAVPEAVPATVEDRRSILEVEFPHDAMTLAGASGAALDVGANLAMVGDELLQFGEAVQIAPRRWRLRRLWRGRRGTEAAIGSQRVGDGFALIRPDALRALEPRRSGNGARLRLRAIGIDDGVEGVSAEVAVTGKWRLPPSPVHLKGNALADGALQLEWVRRSRFGWQWRDGVEVPLGEDAEAYVVRVLRADGGATAIACLVPRLTLPPERASGACRIEVRQLGTHGPSAPAVLSLC